MFNKKDKNKLEAYLKKDFLIKDFLLYISFFENEKTALFIKHKDILISKFLSFQKKINFFKFPTKLTTVNNEQTFLIKKNKTIFLDIKKNFNNNIKIIFKIFFLQNICKYYNFNLYYIKQKESRKLS